MTHRQDTLTAAREYLEREGEAARLRRIDELRAELARVQAMGPVEFVREVGLTDLCPHGLPDALLEFFKAHTPVARSLHFDVRAEHGNEGIRLTVHRAPYEFAIDDPWGKP